MNQHHTHHPAAISENPQGSREQLYFAVGDTSLGAVLVASSPKGVVCIILGDEPSQLAQDLQDRFPAATMVSADPDYQSVIARVVAMIEAPCVCLDLPLDIRGTAFQQRVWHVLRTILAGQTMSYADIARHIDQPTAARAVAGACAANPIAVAIPCHRVVRQDGALSGYRWGIERKRTLLAREADNMANGLTPADNSLSEI
jgi:AraC family transcriptional regulator of adaptative response/methylated-DNA-[protein]-cysteine methyltransferase